VHDSGENPYLQLKGESIKKLEKQRMEFIDMVVRLKRGQNALPKYIIQSTVENYIEILEEKITELSEELDKYKEGELEN
tara:strand:- start:268 stop:504 length:237 start_codon:yes stop_codon:yes gene_type:complete